MAEPARTTRRPLLSQGRRPAGRLLVVASSLAGLLLVVSLARQPVLADPSAAVQSQAVVLLQSSLDNAAAVTSPAVGLGGSTTLDPGDFVPARVGNGAQLTRAGQAIAFPAARGSVQNIRLDRGEIEFWYRPNYAAAADDVSHHLLVVGDVYNPPNLILTEGDRLQLILTDARLTTSVTRAEYRAPLWTAGQWVQIRAGWDRGDTDPLRLHVDGTRVDSGGATNGWDLGLETAIGNLYVGSANQAGDFVADGILDEITVRDAPARPLPATPTPTSQTATPGTGTTPTATAAPSGEVASDPSVRATPATLARPAAGVAFTEPVFGTTLRRVSRTSESGTFETQEYSQLQAFSADNTYLLLVSPNGYRVRRVDDLSLVSGLDTSGWNAARWYAPQPRTLLHFDSNEDTTLRVQVSSVEALTTTTLFTFPSPYERVITNRSSDELSEDGRWLAGVASRADGGWVIFALDVESRQLGAQLPIADLYASGGPCAPDPTYGAVPPDWIGVSPLGRYLVVQWVRDGTTRCSGLETFDLQTGAFVGRAYDGHQHGDLGVLPDGTTEFFMTLESYHPSGNAAIGIRRLPGTATVSEPTYLLTTAWNNEHVSCQGPHGVCLVTTLGDPGDGWSPLEGEIFLLSTDGRVRRLAHHRSSSCGYWVQPRASLSRDGRYAVFASDWAHGTGANSCTGGNALGLGDPYLVALEAATPPAGTATATQTPTQSPQPGTREAAYLPLIARQAGSGAVAPSPTATGTPSVTPSSTVVATPTGTPTATPTALATPTATGTPAAGTPTFTFQLVDDQIRHGQGLTGADIDGDGDEDIIAALSLTDAVYLYLNGGDSTGGGQGTRWSRIPIAADGSIVAMQAVAADFDGDGDLDVAAVGLFDRRDPFNSPGKVAWYENPGLVGGTWTEHTMSTNLWGARSLAAADLTGNGRPDLIVGAIEIAGNGNGLVWFRNESNGASWDGPRAIDTGLNGVETVLVGDLDADGAIDVLAAGSASNQIAWYENSRAAGVVETPTFTRHALASLARPQGLALANLDGDAALEVIATSAGGVSWYDPPAVPTSPWSGQAIDSSRGGENARLAAADFDADGRVDVAVAFGAAAELRWYRNVAAATWSGQAVREGYAGLSFVTSRDLNGDGRPDLVTSTYEFGATDQIAWWQNR